jgi:leucyl aminopeptidase
MTLHANIAPEGAPSTPIWAVTTETFHEIVKSYATDQAIALREDFKGQTGRLLSIYAADGSLARIYFGLGADFEAPSFGVLGAKLPAGDYHLASPLPDGQAQNVLTAFLLGCYVFDRYKFKPAKAARLVAPSGSDAQSASRIVGAVAMGRDLVNTPPNHMGPDVLEGVAVALGGQHGADIEVIKGDDLLTQNYPLIHAVGRGSGQAPRLVILRIGSLAAPKLAIVGKGVTFDTGGLNLKPGAGMALMKKDMGGAACALALFSSLAQARLNVRLSVYLPIVENSMDGTSFRPSDVIMARNGLTVEIDNTDAEGRLILADAVTRASEDGNEMILDMATLTGAARVALGPELPPFFTDDEILGAQLTTAAKATGDHLWRMPLWRPYEDDLESSIADLKNSGGPFAGAINGALFISKFVITPDNSPIWAHFDVYCWNPKDKPGRPAGGEVHAVRAIDSMLRARFGDQMT